MNMNVCLFCGSSTRVQQQYLDLAADFGRLVARRGDKLLYGAGNVGLMLYAAEACMNEGGYVMGVIPQFMIDRNWHLEGLSEFVVTPDMQERKRYLIDHSDLIVVLPGGTGTLDEFFEAVVLRQLGLLDAEIVLVNPFGYYDRLLDMMQNMSDEQFLQPSDRVLYHVVENVNDVFTDRYK